MSCYIFLLSFITDHQNFCCKMNLHNILRQVSYKSKNCFSTGNEELQKSIQVTVLGAHTRKGKLLSFLLKQNPLLSVLHLQGEKAVTNLGVDLMNFDTKCVVKSYPEDDYINCIRGTDVILILPVQSMPQDTPIGERVMKEGRRVYEIAKHCSEYAPRAMIITAVPPVSVLSNVVELVFKETDFYHPGRILGSAAFAQIKANAILGRYQDLDPQVCYAPLLGGPDIDLAVPLFSKAKPVEVFGKGVNTLTALFRGVPEQDFPKVQSKPNFVEDMPTTECHGLNRLITTIGLGMCGAKEALANVYVRSNIINTCKHLVSTVRFARGGVVHNYGIPTLTSLELDLLEKSALQLKQREDMADDFVDYVKHAKEPAFKEKESKEKELLKQTMIRHMHIDTSKRLNTDHRKNVPLLE